MDQQVLAHLTSQRDAARLAEDDAAALVAPAKADAEAAGGALDAADGPPKMGRELPSTEVGAGAKGLDLAGRPGVV